MGLRGPAKTPLEIVKRRGNPGHRKLNKSAPEPSRSRPRASAIVKADPEVWRHFKALVKQAEDMRVLRSVDGRALEKLAQLEADWESTVDMIRRSGFLVKNKSTDMVHISPLFKQKNQIETQLWKAYREFGFTPSARASLHTEGPAKQNPGDDWSDF